MPRPGPRRDAIAIRIGDDVLARVDQRAESAGVSRSERIRMDIELGNRGLRSKAYESLQWEEIDALPEDERARAMDRWRLELEQILTGVNDALIRRTGTVVQL